MIDQATAADVPALVALKDDCIAEMRAQGIEQWDEVYPAESNISSDIAAGTLHVLRDGAQIIGCVTVDETQDPLWSGLDWSTVGEPVAAVHRLMVHPSRQGRGLARRLMAHAEALARANGCRTVRLDTFTANPSALALYDRLGYRETGTAMMRKGAFVGFEKLL